MAGDALDRLQAHLDQHQGRMTAAEVPLGVAVLREYLETGAEMGRSLRRVRAAMKPTDPESIQLGYLFQLVTDGATHEGRLQPLVTYAQSEFPLAKEAGELLAVMQSDRFLQQVGWRPTAPGEKQIPVDHSR